MKFNIALLLALFAAALCHAQDIPIGVTYICSGAHIYIEGCNIHDTSDSSTCMVAHPDHLTPTGLNTYTSVTRGALKKLLPTCTQPRAKELAAAKAFQKRQQDTYNANAQKAEDQLKAATQPPPAYSQPQKTEDTRGARDHPLRHLRTASRQLHGQFTPRRVQSDGDTADSWRL